MCVIEFIEREGSPLYHMEHFIEGEYIKYNSNSGFVSELTRQTPHAFSHFSFERSGHGLIVVDIQGVGDLYTDPQVRRAPYCAPALDSHGGRSGLRGRQSGHEGDGALLPLAHVQRHLHAARPLPLRPLAQGARRQEGLRH